MEEKKKTNHRHYIYVNMWICACGVSVLSFCNAFACIKFVLLACLPAKQLGLLINCCLSVTHESKSDFCHMFLPRFYLERLLLPLPFSFCLFMTHFYLIILDDMWWKQRRHHQHHHHRYHFSRHLLHYQQQQLNILFITADIFLLRSTYSFSLSPSL